MGFQHFATAFVTPLSSKAKNRFHNNMQGNGELNVEQEVGNKLFLSTPDRKYSFWVPINGNSDWEVEL
jgi:hypothetical protein